MPIFSNSINRPSIYRFFFVNSIYKKLKSMEEQKNESLWSKAKKNPKDRKKLIIGIIVFIAFAVFYETNKNSNSNNSSSSSGAESNGNHKCTWCGNSYSGNGYHHIGSTCELASNGWEKYDNKCSTKCCEEAWKNGKH